jgi:hypothetical protein
MPTPAKPPEVIARVRQMLNEGKTQRFIAKECNVSVGFVSDVKTGKVKEATSSISVPTEELKIDGDSATFTGTTTKFIRSEADAIREFNIDTTVWFVKSMQVKAWTVSMNLKEDGATQVQNYGVTLKLERLLPYSMQRATDAIFERMKAHAPKYPKVERMPKATGETFLAVMCLFDAHFGKLCWQQETNNSYDLKIAEAVYRNAVEDLLADVGGRAVERWLFPIGNDFFHMDNRKNMTTGGTPQDVDGRYEKIIEAGEMAVIWAVERMAQTAPVSVVHVPGNHDHTASWHLARTVQLWFRNASRVTVDHAANPRKYFHWNSTLLGLTHGNEEKKQSLPSIMSVERPQEWANSTCREWLCGHEHRARQWQTQPVDTHEQTTIRALRSLAGTDAWHHRKGYLSSKAAEVYFYGKTRGYAGHAVVPARV